MDNKNKILTIVENLTNLFYSNELKEKLADTVYYYNGNDGTAFDRRMNDMTCEIGLGWKEELNNDYYAIKVNFEPKGARFYVYDFAEPNKIIKKGFVTLKQYDFKSISYYLEKEYDKKGLYDKHARIGYIEIFKEEE